jgi:hypothetical protein
MVVYQNINIVNGMRYIGTTTRPLKYRQRDHKYALKGGRHGNRYLQSAYNKYGLKCFKFEIIKECSSLEEKRKRVLSKTRTGPKSWQF